MPIDCYLLASSLFYSCKCFLETGFDAHDLAGRLDNNCCIKMGEQLRSVLLKGAKPCSPQSAVKTPT